jgi:hypothetical protein
MPTAIRPRRPKAVKNLNKLHKFDILATPIQTKNAIGFKRFERLVHSFSWFRINPVTGRDEMNCNLPSAKAETVNWFLLIAIYRLTGGTRHRVSIGRHRM